MQWIIDKQFDFCYGHRVWSQRLEVEYSLDDCLMCRHLHGHQGKIKVFLESAQLQNGMVTDFKHLNWFKAWLDGVLDHKFILDRSDPLFFDLMSHYCREGVMDETKFFAHEEGYWTPRLEVVEDTGGRAGTFGAVLGDAEIALRGARCLTRCFVRQTECPC